MSLPIVRESLCPPGGWHYPEGNFRVVSKIGTFRNLIQCVLEHRLANATEVGDPETDVTNYICTTYPHLCQTPGQAIGTQTQHTYAPTVPRSVNPLQQLIDDLTTWGHVTARALDELELPAEATRRQDVCMKCKFNVPWEHGCSACVGTANRVLYLIRRSKNSPKHKKLGACALNRHCNRTAVWLNRKHMQRRRGTPVNCWI